MSVLVVVKSDPALKTSSFGAEFLVVLFTGNPS